MRFLANENFHEAAVIALTEQGHDVLWVRHVAPGANDSDALALAIRDHRVLLTFDKDFGELAQKAQLPPSCGIVLFRMPMPRPGQVGNRLARLLASRSDWVDHFSVIETGRIRMRPLRSTDIPDRSKT